MTLQPFLLRAALYTLAMLFLFWLADTFLTGAVWHGMTVSRSALTTEYCEFNDVGRFFHQTMNTYSNLVYFFFGVVIWQIGWQDRRRAGSIGANRLQQFPALSLLAGACLMYLCFGSAFFHASMTWVGQRVDMNGTYGTTLALLAVAAYHVTPRRWWSKQIKNVAVGATLLVILLFYEVHLHIPSSILLPGLILATWALVLIHYVGHRRERYVALAVASLVLIVVALYIRALDVQKVGCNPHSLWQGHSLWHLLTGLSSFCSWAFFRFSRRA